MNPAAPGQAPDFEKLHLAERDNLELVGLEDSSIRWIGMVDCGIQSGIAH
ncbi:hypothetical protein [Sporisorium scitamineum]|uniref:Uncharacterized protein n=1 Tax=Sporisorium scitamineum TaxID=49012 RepID=A0A0F7SD44_9BASI|nr:hypothetical protein [Sporisorium scitamineum]